MLFNSYKFMFFFPAVVLLYFLIPLKLRYIWLLGCSYFFYMCWSPVYSLLLLFSTVATWICGIVLEKIKNASECLHRRFYLKLSLSVCLFVNLAILCYFKYSNFFIDNVNYLLSQIHIQFQIPVVDILLPVGISFYTFQALGYIIDVYRGDIYAEKNILKYALFVSFFPQLVAGPIERSKNLLCQVSEDHPFSFEHAQSGFMLMLWGFFLKLVISDRIALYVNQIYGNLELYSGEYLLLATVLFAFQIYCDFFGYSTIAAGAAEILGFHLMDNFNVPYMSRSVAEFWHRWHISLSTWFRDYLYIPLGGNRKGTARKYINIIVTFLVSGLWHGAQWTYVIWGGINGLYQIIGDFFSKPRKKIESILHIRRENAVVKAVQIAIVFVLVDFTWIFFRASNLSESFQIIRSILSINNFGLFFDSALYKVGMDILDFKILALSLSVLFIADYAKYKGIVIRNVICRQNIVIRWLILIGSIVFISLFGIWGTEYRASSFIYFQF